MPKWWPIRSLPQVVSEPPTSSSLAQVEPFSSQARRAFRLMLDSRKDLARKRVTALEKQEYIKWLTDIIPERLGVAKGKKRSWARSVFSHEQGTLWNLSNRIYKKRRAVINEDTICDTVLRVHLNLSHAGQRAIGVEGQARMIIAVPPTQRSPSGKKRVQPVISGVKGLVLAKVMMCMRPTQRSNRKRLAYQQPEALHTTPKSTKHETKSRNSGIICVDCKKESLFL